jgi:hypothetical protein
MPSHKRREPGEEEADNAPIPVEDFNGASVNCRGSRAVQRTPAVSNGRGSSAKETLSVAGDIASYGKHHAGRSERQAGQKHPCYVVVVPKEKGADQ